MILFRALLFFCGWIKLERRPHVTCDRIMKSNTHQNVMNDTAQNVHSMQKTHEEDCPFCELYLAERERGNPSNKDTTIYSAHMGTDEHSFALTDKKSERGLDHL